MLKKDHKLTDFVYKILKLVVVFILVGLMMIEGAFVFYLHKTNFFAYGLVFLMNVIVVYWIFKKYTHQHEESIESLEEAIDSIVKSDKIKILRLRNMDKESKGLAMHINKIILAAKKKKYSINEVLTSKEKEYQELKNLNNEINYKMQELQIFSDISDRIAYSQNIPAIVEVVAGSIGKLLSYTSVSYVLLDDETLNFHIRLEDVVSRSYIKDVKQKMINSLVGLTNDEKIRKIPTIDIITGSAIDDTREYKIGSFFNGPLVIGEKIVGLLNVADVKTGHFTETQMGVLFTITKKVSSAVESLRRLIDDEKGKLNAMVSSISDGLLVVDNNMRIMVVNPAFKIMLNLAISNINMFDIIDKMQGILDVHSKFQETIKLDRLIKEKEFLIGELYLRPIFSPVRDKNGEKIGAVMLLQDRTKEYELQRLREDFTSMMVHELRSPLDGIKKITELISSDFASTNKESHDEFIQMINNSSSRMLELVNDLLDVAKLEAGKFEVIKKASNINNIIKEVVNFFSVVAKNTEVTLNYSLEKNIPENVEFDPVRINQVLNNFISNALKFTKKGGVVSVKASFHTKGKQIPSETEGSDIKWFSHNDIDNVSISDSLVVSIVDSGIGMPKDQLPQLFNKFKQFQATSLSGDKKGTGLGLSIAKGIVEAHGGIIGVSSKEGKGSSFYFMLPINK